VSRKSKNYMDSKLKEEHDFEKRKGKGKKQEHEVK
jgi:hypothetical protein